MKHINKRQVAYVVIGEGANFLVTSFGRYIKLSGEAGALQAFEAELITPGEPDFVRIPDKISAVAQFKE